MFQLTVLGSSSDSVTVVKLSQNSFIFQINCQGVVYCTVGPSGLPGNGGFYFKPGLT